MDHGRKISVVGLGYVGLPVAVAFARAGSHVVAFDINHDRIQELSTGHDRTHEVPEGQLNLENLFLTTDSMTLANADFHIVTVPTPVDEDNRPDLSPLIMASEMLGRILKKGDIVVYESTVYPGATMDVCVPILEQESGLQIGMDFSVGYSPERINPGDQNHRFEVIEKVVAGFDSETLNTVAEVYESVVTAGVHRAPDIKTAEAAKVIENTQRDLNIALMNELAVIFERLDIDTHDVLAAAGTKWNFLPFVPGLVGGHCIGVDPYYLTHRAEQVGYRPEVILAGRKINDSMAVFIVDCITRRILGEGESAEGRLVTVLGVTFKENVPDMRNSRMREVVQELKHRGFQVQVHDPIADGAVVQRDWGIILRTRDELVKGDAIVFGVAHDDFVSEGWSLMTDLLRGGSGVVADIKGCLDRATKPDGVDLWRL